MAKVSVEFDTKSKELTVNMDGKPMANVMSVSISKSYSYAEDSDKQEFGCSLLMLDKQKDDGYQTYTQVVASETKDGLALRDDGGEASGEFVKKSGQTLRQILMRKLFNRE